MPGLARFKPLKFWLGLVLGCCLVLSAGLARALDPAQVDSSMTTDPVPAQHQLGQQIYLDTCGACHVALPPAVMPTETWRRLIQDSQHYGQIINPLVDPSRLLVWNYLQLYSRVGPKEDPIPYRIAESRPFKALHPEVQLPQPLKLESCATCHPAAPRFNFRALSPEWQ
ncbi:cytochrome C [Leptolyngbya sp. FACHB-261]|uniref:cytochrome C n=1 Tax=Leptolyngbya sp. FACHB-261 TaxID=2692806 RepID=UPI00168403E9|nr:cytochrome C [Leptolyngbya sp. FACHB-261]MBD2100858.1 cytochrome C [Leptolyngbya sp. FACHB-261]